MLSSLAFHPPSCLLHCAVSTSSSSSSTSPLPQHTRRYPLRPLLAFCASSWAAQSQNTLDQPLDPGFTKIFVHGCSAGRAAYIHCPGFGIDNSTLGLCLTTQWPTCPQLAFIWGIFLATVCSPLLRSLFVPKDNRSLSISFIFLSLFLCSWPVDVHFSFKLQVFSQSLTLDSTIQSQSRILKTTSAHMELVPSRKSS